MIRHIVFFSAKDKAHISAIKQGLERLSLVGEHTHFEVKENARADQIANEIDVVVYAEFPNYEALERYKNHPEYTRAIHVVRPLRELRFAADIEVA